MKYKNRAERKANDPIYALQILHRTAIYNAIKNSGHYLTGSFTYYILGCTSNIFINHMEALFVDGMCWENHGDWHIDHVIPMASVKTIDDVLTISHYKNLQPLWKFDNMKKNSIVDGCQINDRSYAKSMDRPSLSNNASNSKLAGVTWNKDRKKWRVRIKQVCYGLYTDYEEAEQVCLDVRKKIYVDAI